VGRHLKDALDHLAQAAGGNMGDVEGAISGAWTTLMQIDHVLPVELLHR
jgi:hypothetical protein